MIVWGSKKDLFLGFLQPEDFLVLEPSETETFASLIGKRKLTLRPISYVGSHLTVGELQEQMSGKMKAVVISESPK